MSTFSTAITGLKAYQTDLGVIGNNIANANTTGYKASRAQFSELLVQTIEGATPPSDSTGGIDPMQIGAGVIVGGILNIQTQGAIEPTGRSSDLAIQGEGFYVLSNGESQIYTRVGSFELDANGNLVDAGTGLKVQGIDGDIHIPLGSNEAAGTTEVELVGNLNASDADDPITLTENESTLETSFFIIDTLGGKHQVNVTFSVPGSANTGLWDYAVSAASNDTGVFTGASAGQIQFASGGNVLSITGPGSGGGIFTFNPGNAAASAQEFSIDFDALTGFAALSSVSMKQQDGVPPGSLTSFTVSNDGMVNGIYSNGLVTEMDTLKLASFSNPAGLLRLANGQFAETPNSGVAQYGVAGTGGRGTIVAGALEQSNVDLGTELVNLIIAQRGYEANAQVISVANQIQQTTLNLLR
ncbi:MAG: flagellar hook protein FlgE [Candidatus Methylomirabilis oxygeniifera]|uniref:Flagellar hook protein FlgE n=1 Tax=Methylomirabilis oxygeniifera TaxID=671143 RepID=D5MGC4_METO1|nr:MAG: flagellar hook protein FlgE [Candidatus Methylomirabilis oxyfera]CBE68805.1 putative Flagellar hook protein flgE [Candidatus Methylomirabilis oxyfera]